MAALLDSPVVPLRIPARPAVGLASDYERVEAALAYVAANVRDQPALADIASQVGLSEFHFQRVFTRWAGVSPKRFLQYLTLESAKRSLERSASVLDAALDAGLSGPGRLHDLFVSVEAVTPGEYRRRGEGVTIRWGYHPTPFGEALFLLTERGLCGLGFVAERGREATWNELSRGWERATFVGDSAATAPFAKRAFTPGGTPARLPLLLRGTPFQLKVWEALLRIPPGCVTSYEWLAHEAGGSSALAARAAGGANACNPVAWLIPCHRVIHKSGFIAGYRWGNARKLAMLGSEATAVGSEPDPR